MTKLNPEDFHVHSSNIEEFTKFYMKFRDDGITSVMKIMKEFDQWYSDHKKQLKSLYKDYVGDEDIMKWCRKNFFAWKFNQEIANYNKDLKNEIDKLTK